MKVADVERLKKTKDFLREQHQEALKKCKFPELKPLIIDTYHENIKAFDVAISALEKQIPKKPIDVSLTQYNFLWVCPNCESRHANEWCGTKRKLPYCSICGQALDWGDSE